MAQRKSWTQRLRDAWPPLAFGVAVFVLWWAVTALGLVPPFLIPSPASTYFDASFQPTA